MRQPLCPSELPPHYAPGGMVLLPIPQGGDCDQRLSGALIQLVGGAAGPGLGQHSWALSSRHWCQGCPVSPQKQVDLVLCLLLHFLSQVAPAWHRASGGVTLHGRGPSMH